MNMKKGDIVVCSLNGEWGFTGIVTDVREDEFVVSWKSSLGWLRGNVFPFDAIDGRKFRILESNDEPIIFKKLV